MQLSGATVLVTGGASGIGFSLAERFLNAGAKVLVCGRREDKLREAKLRHPDLATFACDLARPEQREALRDWVEKEFPRLNILVNNAGIQRRISLLEPEDWGKRQNEIAINVEAPVHLCSLLLPLLRRQPEATIVNVSSGLAFAPAAFAPVYSATKAFLHSFTLSLRHQLSGTGVKVVEIVPPAVNTDLGGPGLHTRGADVNEFADSVFRRFQAGELEIGFGTSEEIRRASREKIDERFAQLNQILQ